MLIEIYRNEVRDAYNELLKVSDPPELSEMNECVRGNLGDFFANYYDDDYDDDFAEDGWWTREHREFYFACERLKTVERREYNLALLKA